MKEEESHIKIDQINVFTIQIKSSLSKFINNLYNLIFYLMSQNTNHNIIFTVSVLCRFCKGTSAGLTGLQQK